jgi:hypothetical protein
MNLTEVQDQAIWARMALIVGAKTFDRLFAGIYFGELDRDILFVYAKDEETAAEVEDDFSLPHPDHRCKDPEARRQHCDGSAEAVRSLSSRQSQASLYGISTLRVRPPPIECGLFQKNSRLPVAASAY